MRFLDFEANQVDERLKSLTLTYAGFLVGLGGGAASLLDGSRAPFSLLLGLCMIPFVFGLLTIISARGELGKSLRDAAREVLDDERVHSDEGALARGLDSLNAPEVWAVAFPNSYESRALTLFPRWCVGIGAGGMIAVVGLVAFT